MLANKNSRSIELWKLKVFMMLSAYLEGVKAQEMG